MQKRVKSIKLVTIILLILIIYICITVTNTIAKYVKESDLKNKIDIAFWIVNDEYNNESENLIISNIYPSNDPYEYLFSVSNYKDNKRTEVAIEYNINLKSTTNIPLEYKIFEKQEDGSWKEMYVRQSIVSNNTSYNNKVYEEYVKKLVIYQNEKEEKMKFGFEKNETKYYKLQIFFPISYNSEKYSDLVEGIKLNINATQKLDKID